MNSKKVYILMMIFAIVFIGLGGTFAAWQWNSTNSQKTEVVFTVEVDDDGEVEYQCAADGGGNISSSDVVLAPASCTNSEFAIKREVLVKPTINIVNIDISMDLWLNINSLGSGLSNSQNFKYVLTTDENSCTSGVISEGNFYGKSDGDTVTILKKKYSSTLVDKYYLYIWLDKEETSLSTANQPFDFQLGGICTVTEKNEFITVNANGGVLETVEYTTSGNYTYEVLNKSKYKLETWGAQGGTASSILGGYGGYSAGTVELLSGENMYVYVGGKGTDGVREANYTASGGYNGGGNGYVGSNGYYVAGGGGATHIALSDGLLSTLSSNVDDVLIVSGGGGGSAFYTSTYKTLSVGHGGGFIGVQSSGKSTSAKGYADGGTQDNAGELGSVKGIFGQGANASSSSHAGGGGGYYGGNTATYSGGGGSGYIGNSRLTDKVMYCYNCTTSTDVSTLTNSTTDFSADAIANYAKSGNGAVKISLLEQDVANNADIDNLFTPKRDGYVFDGWNTEPDGSGITITSDNFAYYSTIYAMWN